VSVLLCRSEAGNGDSQRERSRLSLQTVLRAGTCIHTPIQNDSVPIQLAHCPFTGLAISDAKI